MPESFLSENTTLAVLLSRPVKKAKTLVELQEEMRRICQSRDWDTHSVSEIFLLFTEEVGELAKAIRERINLSPSRSQPSRSEDLEGEFADVLAYLVDLANHLDVDLQRAFDMKMSFNERRKWEK